MSGSYDKRGLPKTPRPPERVERYLADDGDPTTGPPTEPSEYAYPEYETAPVRPEQDFYVTPSTERDHGPPSPAPIVPAGSVTGSSLTLVISIMCFFACLTAGAVYLMNQSASAWLRDISSEVTIQIEPTSDIETVLTNVLSFASAQRGIVSATPIPLETSRVLLEPWLGNSEALDSLPLPRLVAIQIDSNTPPDLEGLRARLSSEFKGVTLDDHRQWQQQIRTVTRSFALGGIAILLLVGAATTAIIVSATRSAMLSNREIVEVLHFVGANDRFIAREFDRHFLTLGIRAGLVGAFAAIMVFLAMPTVMEVLGGGSMTLAEIKRLIGSGSLDAAGFLLLGIVVVVVAALCMLTSRFGVFRILNHR